MSHKITRRNFLKTTVAASTVYSLMPSSVLGANERVNLACIGIGGRGKGLTQTFNGKELANIVALCDVNMGSEETATVEGLITGVPKFKDFRRMYDKMAGDIDAVTIAVPDHSHFPIAMLSMSLGKGLYVEKPLAHTFQEVELMMAAEKKYKVAAQMGNQGHSGNNYFQFKKWVDAGIIKNVTRVDAYMNKHRRWHGWEIDGFPTGETMPKTIDWDTWLGTAKHHEFSKLYHPGHWRSWYDFGNGAFGDWGPHTLDTVHRFLKLGLPETTKAVKLEGHNDFIFPQASTIMFQFPARGKDMPACDITWYDGQENFPPRPKELEEGRKIEVCGKIIYSDELVFKGGTHSDTLRIIPEAKMSAERDRLPVVTEKASDHAENLLLACKGLEKTRSTFAVSGPLTQVFLIGVIAQRLNTTLKFDRKTKQITNNKLANDLLAGPPPRKGWEEYYKL
jgi:predicted dehydrogenase